MILGNGKYVLEQRLGGGGMADVFLARTVGAEGFVRQVAIKRILAGYSDNPTFADMFASEARLTSQLQHPNIVSTLDFDRDTDGRLYLVMELVNGVALSSLLESGPLPFSVVIFLALEVLRGLDYAHDLPISFSDARGIVHRDISPHNVLLSWEGAVKVSDFGIAKAHSATLATASQIIKGKPAYMSPEQARGEPLDGRSDLFAVGVMLFEMLCLRPLFAGHTVEETLHRVFTAPIPAPRDLRPEIPADLSAVVASFLRRDLDRRIRTASAGMTALRGCRDCPMDGREELIATLSQRFPGRAPVRTRDLAQPLRAAQNQVRQAGAPPPAGPNTVTRPSEVRPPSSDRRWFWAVASVLIVVIVATAAILANARATKPPAKAPLDTDGATSAAPSPPPHSGVTEPVAKGAEPIAVPSQPAPTSSAPAIDAGTDAPATSIPEAPRPAPERKPAPARVPGRRPASPQTQDRIQEVHVGLANDAGTGESGGVQAH